MSALEAKSANILTPKQKSPTQPQLFCKIQLFFVTTFKIATIVRVGNIAVLFTVVKMKKKNSKDPDIYHLISGTRPFPKVQFGFLNPIFSNLKLNFFKGVAPDLPALYGARPICKDYLKGECRRGRMCRFRHLTPRQYDIEMSYGYDGGYDGSAYGHGYNG